MRRVWSLVVALGLLGTPGDAQACGDKFLVIGRGVRAQRARGAVHKTSILIYASPRGRLPEALKAGQLETNLRLAGHTLRQVDDRDTLSAELKAGRHDLVMADISDMLGLEPEVGSAPSRPYLLPVIHNPTGEELAEAERLHRCVMRSPSKKQHYLAVIDEALKQRRRGGRAAYDR